MIATIIAVDGPAASGKGTLARQLADHYGYALLDTGLLYRAVGLKAVGAGDTAPEEAYIAAAEALKAKDLENPDLRQEKASRLASLAGNIPGVRKALLDFQRHFAHHPPEARKGAVLDGRDIGTVVCPEADFKFFVTANVEIRAQRRFKELIQRGEEAIYARVLADLQERDARDSTRAVAPLRAAEDAVILDTSHTEPEAVLAQAILYIGEGRKSSRPNRKGRSDAARVKHYGQTGSEDE